MIEFATKENLRDCTNNLIIEAPLVTDHIFGAAGSLAGPDWDVINPSGHWTNLIKPELQMSKYSDSVMCTAFSLANALEFVHKQRYGEEIDLSDLFIGAGSGTIPGRGNSKRAPAEFVRTKGFLFESEYPFDDWMTEQQMYATMAQKLYDLAASRLKQYVTGYKLLPVVNQTWIKMGLTFSPVRIDVEGHMTLNDKNYMVRNGSGDTHEVIIFDYEDGECWWIWDSARRQYIKMAWDYQPGTPMIHSIKKKAMPKLYKKVGAPAIYVKHCSQDLLIPIASGVLQGGDLFRTMFGVDDYKAVPRVKDKTGQDWLELPFPVAPYDFITKNR